MKVLLVIVLLMALFFVPWSSLLPSNGPAANSSSTAHARPIDPASGTSADGGAVNHSTPAASPTAAGLSSKTGEMAKSPANGCGASYVLNAGETLSGVARRCGVDLQTLLAANPQITNPDQVMAGQTLSLARKASQPAPPASGANGSTASSGTGSGPNPAAQSVPVTGASAASSTAAASSAANQTYTVKSGDTLQAIASQTGTSINDLMYANKSLLTPDEILSGQALTIPAPGSAPADYNWQVANLSQAGQTVMQNGKITYQPKPGEHWVHVDLASQTLEVFDGTQLVNTFLISSGIARYPTVTGHYRIYVKMRYDEMVGPGYDLKNVPYVMYFYKGYGLHGTYWHHNFGHPMSHGCVNLSTPDAAWLYNYLSVGSMVEIQ